MLSEMHDKLSQAVKLYDQILTQQVSHSPWRTTSHNVQSHPYTPNAAPNGYTPAQWSPQVSPTSQIQYRPFGEPQAAGRVMSPPIQPVSINQPQYVPYPPLQAPYQAEQSQFSTNVPVTIAPPTIHSLSYTQPSTSYQSTPVAKPASLPQSPPPIVQYQQPQSRPQIPSPQQRQQQQRQQQQQQQQQSIGSNLVRHNTVAYNLPSAPSVPTPSLSHQLGRSNTVVGASVPQRPLHYQTQAHSQLSSAAVLPQFPSVPTSAPEPTYSMHAQSMSTGFEQKEERKEALLIDL